MREVRLGLEVGSATEQRSSDLVRGRQRERGAFVAGRSRRIGLERAAEQLLLVAEGRVEARPIDPHRGGQVGERCPLVAEAPEHEHRLLECLVQIECPRPCHSAPRRVACLCHVGTSDSVPSGTVFRHPAPGGSYVPCRDPRQRNRDRRLQRDRPHAGRLHPRPLAAAEQLGPLGRGVRGGRLRAAARPGWPDDPDTVDEANAQPGGVRAQDGRPGRRPLRRGDRRARPEAGRDRPLVRRAADADPRRSRARRRPRSRSTRRRSAACCRCRSRR